VKGKARYDGNAIGGIRCDKQGGIHIFGRLIAGWSWEKFQGDATVFHVMSDDNCKTWSAVQTIASGYRYSGIHQPLVLKGGRIVLPIWHAFDDKTDWAVSAPCPMTGEEPGARRASWAPASRTSNPGSSLPTADLDALSQV